MKKALCLLLCVVMAFGLCTTAFASGQTKYETITGEYKYMPALSIFSDHDGTYHFTYSDEYFTGSGYDYNHELAIMSMDMVQSAAVSVEGDWSVSNKNFFDLMKKIGFENPDCNYYSTHEPLVNSIGVNMATKKIVDGGEKYTLVAVGLRGHGYGNEWGSNLILGYSGDHQGFAEARDNALDYVKEYLAKYNVTGKIKIWLTGYSRSAITANMVGGKIDQGFNFGKNISFDLDDLYCYTFEAPRGTANTACRDSLYYNIHNIVNANDIVPEVSLAKWGHSRFGVDYILPCRQYDGDYYYSLKPKAEALIGKMDTMNIAGLPIDLIDLFRYISLDPATAIAKQDVTQIEFFGEVIDALTDSVAYDRAYYVDHLQQDFSELFTTLLGSRTDHLGEALIIFGQKFTQLPNLRALYNSMTISGAVVEGPIVDVVVDLLMDSLKEAGASGYDGDQLRAMLMNIVPKLLVMFAEHPDTTLTLVGNIANILWAHCPEIGRAWIEVTPAEFFEKQSPSSPSFFADVSSSAYYYDAVKWATNKGIAKGYDSTYFGPDDSCTRAQVASFLWRAAGCPEPKASSCQFVDVDSQSPHYKAIIWASEQGITLGYDATHFRPDKTCTRAQIVTFIYRYEGSPKTSAKCPFVDVKNPYLKSVTWAAEQGITLGYDATHFKPDIDCTRAQIVTFLYRDMA